MNPTRARRLPDSLSLLALSLCAATVVLWGDSYRYHSSVGWATSSRSGSLLSRRGELYFTTADDPLGPPEPPRWRRIRPEENDGMYTADWRVTRRVLGFALQRQHVSYYRQDPPGTVVWDVVIPYWFCGRRHGGPAVGPDIHPAPPAATPAARLPRNPLAARGIAGAVAFMTARECFAVETGMEYDQYT